MAQSALTVTPANPTPPTNFQFTGATGPNPPNLTKLAYAGAFANPPTNQPPAAEIDFDTPAALADPLAFAANRAAFTFAGTGATSGGTENTYPGTGTGVSKTGAVPASTSVAHEGAGTENVVTQTYPTTVFVPGGSTYSAGMVGGPLRTFSDLGNFTGVASPPNQQHASSLSPLTNPAISATPATALSPSTIASGVNTFALTVTGTNFTPQSVVYINGVPQVTVYVSPTSLTVAAALKKATAGTFPVTVVTGGVVVTANAPVMTYT